MNLHGGQLGRALDRRGRDRCHDLGRDSGQVSVDATAATTSATLSCCDGGQDLDCDLVHRGRDSDRVRGHDLSRHSGQLACDLDRRGRVSRSLPRPTWNAAVNSGAVEATFTATLSR